MTFAFGRSSDWRRSFAAVEYGEPTPANHTDADAVLEIALAAADVDPGASRILVGLALLDPGPSYVEEWCIRVGNKAVAATFRGTAALCAGHLGRRFGTLQHDTVRMVHELAADDTVRVANPQVEDALDDADRFAN